ncbi:unnamed protein product [Cylindrotheca closterium]|uniref:Uncharacterized protein n=1 Tax=Cylindrotheca closterium TaxID=2856 RepID=A0AAD2FKG4_9STRA|nr:unnamed protein product [Cylindrotheca closterium]
MQPGKLTLHVDLWGDNAASERRTSALRLFIRVDCVFVPDSPAFSVGESDDWIVGLGVGRVVIAAPSTAFSKKELKYHSEKFCSTLVSATTLTSRIKFDVTLSILRFKSTMDFFSGELWDTPATK